MPVGASPDLLKKSVDLTQRSVSAQRICLEPVNVVTYRGQQQLIAEPKQAR